MKSLFRGAYLRGASAVALSISLAACTANPTPLDRPGDVPPAFTAPMDKSAPLWPQGNFFASFGADELAPLEVTAQKENLDIAQAAARVLQAEAQDGIALSALFPSLGASGGQVSDLRVARAVHEVDHLLPAHLHATTMPTLTCPK